MDYAIARHNMVESQIRTNKVTDPRVIAAMEELPRELFLPKARRGAAYVDEDLPLGRGRFIMEPMVLARLIQALEAGPGDLALNVGSGCGYACAVLARICGTVVGLESDGRLASEATAVLAELGVDNAAVVGGPLAKGYAKQAPYDVILLGGAVAALPQALTDQLADGGRLAAVIADGPSQGKIQGKAILLTRVSGALSRRVIFDASIPPLPGFAVKRGFVF